MAKSNSLAVKSTLYLSLCACVLLSLISHASARVCQICPTMAPSQKTCETAEMRAVCETEQECAVDFCSTTDCQTECFTEICSCGVGTECVRRRSSVRRHYPPADLWVRDYRVRATYVAFRYCQRKSNSILSHLTRP